MQNGLRSKAGVVLIASLAMLVAMAAVWGEAIVCKVSCMIWDVEDHPGPGRLFNSLDSIAENFYGQADPRLFEELLPVGDYPGQVILVPAGSKWEIYADNRIDMCLCKTQKFANFLSWSESGGLVIEIGNEWKFFDLDLHFETDDGWPLIASSKDTIQIKSSSDSAMLLSLKPLSKASAEN